MHGVTRQACGGSFLVRERSARGGPLLVHANLGGGPWTFHPGRAPHVCHRVIYSRGYRGYQCLTGCVGIPV